MAAPDFLYCFSFEWHGSACPSGSIASAARSSDLERKRSLFCRAPSRMMTGRIVPRRASQVCVHGREECPMGDGLGRVVTGDALGKFVHSVLF